MSMKILFLTQVLPYPPNSGPKFKTWNVLKYLSRRHQVVLVSFVREEKRESLEAIRALGIEVHTVPMKRGVARDIGFALWSLLTGQPFMIVRDTRSGMSRLIHELCREHQFHVVHVDQLNMAPYASAIPQAVRVLDAHNALWVLYKRLAEVTRTGPTSWLLNRDWRLLRAYEGQVCREFDHVIAVSSIDKAALAQAAGSDADISVIPITVDMAELNAVDRSSDDGHILHIGTMYWPPNSEGVLWFLERVWPLIRARDEDVVFDIVGARPPQAIVELGRLDECVRVHGFVDDPQVYLQSARVMIVPLRAGSGMRVKILEGLARGIPIVTTSLGVEGIEAQSGKHLIVADSVESFADGVLQLLQNRGRAEALAAAGRALVERNHDYRRILRKLDSVYQRARSPRSARDGSLLPTARTQ